MDQINTLTQMRKDAVFMATHYMEKISEGIYEDWEFTQVKFQLDKVFALTKALDALHSLPHRA